VLQATDLVALIGEHVQLRPKGREHVGLCPFHDDRTPSMHVVTHKGDSFFKCFACSEAGNAIDFMMKYHHMDFPTALRTLAARAGITLQPRQGTPRRDGEPTRESLLEATAFAANFFRRVLQNPAADAGAAARKAIADRGIDSTLADAFALGAAPNHWDALVETVSRKGLDRDAFVAAGLLKARGERDGHYDTFRNRLIFPIHDELDRPIAFGARRLDPEEEPKYLNSPETPIFSKSRTLYGINRARRAIIETKTAIVCEGYTDVIACHRAGRTNVVATLGTALTREHARLLRRLGDRIVLLFDGDTAGQRAADRALEIFMAEPVEVVVCTLPDGLDPDDLLAKPDGAARFDEAVENAEDALEHVLRNFGLRYGSATSLSARQQRLEEMLAHLTTLGFHGMNPIRRQMVVATLAQRTAIDERTLLRSLPAPRTERPTPPTVEPRGSVAADVESMPRTGDAPTDESTMSVTEAVADGLPREVIEAERRLLGLLMAHPELVGVAVDAGEGFRLPVLELFPADSLLYGPHRAIAEPLFAAADEGRPTSMQSLMGELVPGALRSLASSLYMESARRTAGDESIANQMLAQTCSDLDAAHRRHRCRVEMSQPCLESNGLESNVAEALRRKLELRRTQGHDPSALIRSARS